VPDFQLRAGGPVRCSSKARATVKADVKTGLVRIASGRRDENCLDHRTSSGDAFYLSAQSAGYAAISDDPR